jgi:hypothetical protein
MNEDLHNNIDDLFRKGLEGKEDQPSRSVWAAIEKGLDTNPLPAPTTPGNGSWFHPVLLKGILGITLIALLGVAVHLWEKTDADQEAVPAKIRTNAIGMGARGKVRPEEKPLTTPSIPSKHDIRMISDVMDKNETMVLTTQESEQPVWQDDRSEDENKKSLEIENNKAASKPAEIYTSHSEKTVGESPEPETLLVGRDQRIPLRKNEAPPDADKAKTSGITSPQNSGLVSIDRNKSLLYFVPDAKESAGDPIRRTDGMVVSDNRDHGLHIPSAAGMPVGGNRPDIAAQPAAAKASLRPNKLMSRFSITPVMTWNKSTLTIQENKSFGGRNGRERVEYRETEQTRTTFTPGILMAFSISPVLSIQTGVTEYRNDISVSPKDMRAVRDRDGRVRYRLDCSAGSYFIDPKRGTAPNVGDSVRIASSDIHMRYASIPFSLKATFGNGRIRYSASGGMDMNFLVKGRSTTMLQAGSGEKFGQVRSEGLRSNFIKGMIGGEVDIRIGKRTGLVVMPQYRFALKTINEHGPVKSYPKTFSLLSGLRISL